MYSGAYCVLVCKCYECFIDFGMQICIHTPTVKYIYSWRTNNHVCVYPKLLYTQDSIHVCIYICVVYAPSPRGSIYLPII